jgi:hypothetical protein
VRHHVDNDGLIFRQEREEKRKEEIKMCQRRYAVSKGGREGGSHHITHHTAVWCLLTDLIEMQA